MTPDQQAGWEAKLAIHNADITRSNQAVAEHNALLPEGTPPVEIRPLLTLDEYIAYEMNRIAEAGQRQNQASAKTNLELLNERDAALAQVAAVTADILVLVAERDTLTTDLATANATINTLTTQVASLESQLQEVTESRDVLFIKKQAVDHDLAEAEVKIAWLESIRTYDPNQIKSKAFYDRITKDEMNDVAVLALSGDATAAAIYAKFNDYVKNEWQVLLDDPEVVGGTQYLTYTGTFKEGRAAQITRPASREEAYIQA
jgi:hypothetical protein